MQLADCALPALWMMILLLLVPLAHVCVMLQVRVLLVSLLRTSLSAVIN
jgi:hypothetical protein